MKVGFVYNDKFLLHQTGLYHPERPERLKFIIQGLQESKLWQKLQQLVFDKAELETIQKIHSRAHINFVKEVCAKARYNNSIELLDAGDTPVCMESFDVALLAVGGCISAVDAVMSGVLKRVFCAVRPPGHHAESNTPMGFCLFNNAAITADYARERYNLKRILILDWDVHHGNGTQEIFYEDDQVFYISLHQYPFYPGTGARSERGKGKGEGFTLNCPMRAGSGENEYIEAFEKDIIPIFSLYQPELFIISAGFDAHKSDPLANINLTEESFVKMTEYVVNYANKFAEGRIISILEGGYDLEALKNSVKIHIETLMKD
ncbi:MAG: Acetylspermidine deacetylase [Ignavibacteriae bacterium]|nr:MAG: Acetylspermidine deacetylase [Ignavibacteriota bacterium]